MTPADVPKVPDLELDGFVGAFEAAYARAGSADPVNFLPPADHPRYRDALRELVRVDLEFAWDRGEGRRVEAYRDRLPDLFADPEALRAVAWEEFRLRQAAGEAPTPAEYRHRLGVELFDPASSPRKTQPFDGRAASPADLDLAVDPPATAVPGGFPTIGAVAAGAELLAELGRGERSRVYLAREGGPAGRLVVLKLSTDPSADPAALARLRHPAIVPVYSVHRHGPYHVTRMPYLGRTTVADLLAAFREAGGPPASGRQLADLLAGRADGTPMTGSGTSRLERLTYPEAVLRLGVQLADGLAHAHEHGVAHRNLKPSNVLVADDGGPVLLDFAPADPGREADAPRADVYALGLILSELLTGGAGSSAPSGVRAGVTPAVGSILATCLHPDPARRYPSSAALREDLRRQLDHRPLKFAPDPSPRERLAKWARRHPRLSSFPVVAAGVAAVLLIAGGLALARHRHLGRLDAAAARNAARSERNAVRSLVIAPEPPASFCAEAADRARAVAARYGALDDPNWPDGPLVTRLPAAERPAVRRDVAFLLTDLSAALLGLAQKEPDPDRRTAL